VGWAGCSMGMGLALTAWVALCIGWTGMVCGGRGQGLGLACAGHGLGWE
jgi:hypothetical protein